VDGACLKGILACGLVAAVLATTCGNDGGAQADATDPGAEARDVVTLDSDSAQEATPDAADGDVAEDPANDADAEAADAPVEVAEKTLTLAKDWLQFYSIAGTDVRLAVGGYDPKNLMCATLVWNYTVAGKTPAKVCDDFGPQFPYVFVRPSATGECDKLADAGNVEVVSASGCVDFASIGPASTDSVDVTVHVSGTPLTGSIIASSL
jgi:hypothetical protein